MGVVEDPFETVADVRDRLNEVESVFRAEEDRRAVFLTVYTTMTEAVEDGLDAGFFDDPEWLADLLVTFANHYRRALVRYERGRRQRVPRPWAVAYDATMGGGTLVLQDALLGVNAHINYDLAYTLETVRIDPDRAVKFDDYVRINEILARLVDGVQQALASVYDSELVGDLDSLFGSLDEWLAGYGLAESRDFAWNNASLLVDFDWPFVRTYVDWRLTSVSTGAAHLIVSPPLDRSTHREARSIERRLSPVAEFRTAFQDVIPQGDPSTWSISG